MKKVVKLISAIVLILIFIMSLAMISTAEGRLIYKSTIKTNLPDYVKDTTSSSYLIIDNYEIYKYLGYSDKGESFFYDNLLIINCIYNGYVVNNYKNTGVEIKDNVLNVYYTFTSGPRYAQAVTYVVDIIELKKSDVKGVDLTKEMINIKEGNIMSNTNDVKYTDYTVQMKYIDAYDLIDKPEKVVKVKTKSTKIKQLKVTWKKINGAKYQVQYSLKKNMKKAKAKKNITKNTVTLKKLKSEKKYYVRVRAYKKIGNKTYLGKWSKKAVKTVK